MVWTNAGVIHPSRNWQYTNVVEGEFFRLSHNYSDLPTEYFQAEITQVEEDEDGAITTFGHQVIEASPTSEVIQLIKPDCFTNRRIAIRQVSRDVDLPPIGRVYSWAIGIERFDPNTDTGGGETPTTGFSTNQATLRGVEGLTLISSTIIDDNNIALPDIGFNFPYFGGNYRTGIKVNSNSFFQFATSATSANPAPEFLNGVSLGSTDGNVNKLYGLALSANAYLIRFEGHSSYTQQTINKVWEAILFSDGAIQLTFGVWESSTVGFVSNGTNPATKADWAITANSSYVIDFVNGLPRVRAGSYTL